MGYERRADGILNPQELTIEYFARKADDREFDPGLCLYGYPAAKMADHVSARRIFERCAKEGSSPRDAMDGLDRRQPI